jgi:radical SAM protein with 4Fe4S-binding SPASM domain
MEHPIDRLPRVPRLCFWELTDACNLRCVHCEQSAGTRRADELTAEEALRLVDELVDAGVECVNLTGGEPLLRPDWARLARRFADRGVRVVLITNGVAVGEATIARMVDAGVAGVGVSLDGEREVHDGIRRPAGPGVGSVYDHALRAMELVAASSLTLAVITQLHRRNAGRLRELHRLLVDRRVAAWQLQICMPLGRLLEHTEQYLLDPTELPRLELDVAELIRDGRVPIRVADNLGYYGREEATLRRTPDGRAGFWTGCTAGLRVVGICSDGEVKGCPSHPRAFAAGNVRREPFAAIWADRSRFAYNTEWDEERLVGGCVACALRRLCRGGCRTMAWSVTGTIYDNPFCLQRVPRRR